MELTNEFSVKVPVAEAWAVLTDLERIAPCMPGFELQEVEGDEYRGTVKVKVGPMIASYKGKASFQERDEVSHRAVVRAEGRDIRGQGNASATVTAMLEPRDGGTHVTVHTDLVVTGKVAQFGRGVLADVSSKLLGQFVRALEADVLMGTAPSAGGTTGATAENAAASKGGAPAPGSEREGEPLAATAGPRRIDSPSAAPVDLLATAGGSVMKRVAPIAVVLLVAVVWLVLRC